MCTLSEHNIVQVEHIFSCWDAHKYMIIFAGQGDLCFPSGFLDNPFSKVLFHNLKNIHPIRQDANFDIAPATCTLVCTQLRRVLFSLPLAPWPHDSCSTFTDNQWDPSRVDILLPGAAAPRVRPHRFRPLQASHRAPGDQLHHYLAAAPVWPWSASHAGRGVLLRDGHRHWGGLLRLHLQHGQPRALPESEWLLQGHHTGGLHGGLSAGPSLGVPGQLIVLLPQCHILSLCLCGFPVLTFSTNAQEKHVFSCKSQQGHPEAIKHECSVRWATWGQSTPLWWGETCSANSRLFRELGWWAVGQPKAGKCRCESFCAVVPRSEGVLLLQPSFLLVPVVGSFHSRF